jgi:hypothetical protein
MSKILDKDIKTMQIRKDYSTQNKYKSPLESNTQSRDSSMFHTDKTSIDQSIKPRPMKVDTKKKNDSEIK